MPITKQYLRYSEDGIFNTICSAGCNVAFVAVKGQIGRYVAVGACENVVVWDLKLSEKVLVLPGEKSEVSCLAASPDQHKLAVGYADGTIKIFDLESSEILCTFMGHRSAITSLTFHKEGHLIASGSNDTEVIVWDIVAEKGLHRFSEHKGPVTQVLFMQNQSVLISSSKDTFVKFWDLETGHGFNTLVAHSSEVWNMALVCNDKFLVTTSTDMELAVWQLVLSSDSSNSEDTKETKDTGTVESLKENFGPVHYQKAGALVRKARQIRGRLQGIVCDPTGQILACHSNDRSVEFFHFATEQEAVDRFYKKKKDKKKNKTPKKENEEELIESAHPTFKDYVLKSRVIMAQHTVKSCDVVCGNAKELRICVTTKDNTVELHGLILNITSEETCIRELEKMGHRTEVRAVGFSSDGLAIATGSAEAVKMWNRASLSCLRTIETSYVYSLCFVAGDRHLLVGSKGVLLIIDIGTAEVLEKIEAHESEIWSIIQTPDQRGCITASGDKSVKFFDYALVAPSESSKGSAKELTLLHTRSLQADEGVLNVCVSPDSRLLAVALLDSTVKIYFLDTLKFFVQLYGHKLPVLCMSISYDSTLICTGSADRNIKIWGLDFGDCHKSLFGHEDTVTGLQFVPKTHYFFSCGKDGTVKQWDADSYERIQTLQGHRGHVHSLDVSASHVVSCGADRSVRLWTRTSEPLVLEDQREEEREEEEQQTLATGEETVVPGQPGSALPSKKTVGAEKAAELLLEALTMAEDLVETSQIPPLMVALGMKDSHAYVLHTLRNIRASDLEEALLLLPFSSARQLLGLMPGVLRLSCHSEVALNTLTFLLHVYHDPIVATGTLLPDLREIQSLALNIVDTIRDRVGCNLHGLLMLQRRMELEQSVQLFQEASHRRKSKDKKRRQREKAMRRAILTL